MQENAYPSLSLKQLAFWIVASFIGGGGAVKVFSVFLNWKKQPAEIHVTEAQAVKTRAEARKINAEADFQVNSVIEKLHTRADQLAATIDEVRSERDAFKLRYELQSIELRLRDDQIKRMKGVMDARNIKLSDFDEPKE